MMTDADEDLLDRLCQARLERRGYRILRKSHEGITTVDQIKARTADHYGVTVSDIIGRGRRSRVVKARQTAMYLARTQTKLTLVEIGAEFLRDHGTVIWACRIVEKERVSYGVPAILSALELDNPNGLR